MSAPASARAIATAWPMPRVPPVTRAVWFSKENIFWKKAAIVGGCNRMYAEVTLFSCSQNHGHEKERRDNADTMLNKHFR